MKRHRSWAITFFWLAVNLALVTTGCAIVELSRGWFHEQGLKQAYAVLVVAHGAAWIGWFCYQGGTIAQIIQDAEDEQRAKREAKR